MLNGKMSYLKREKVTLPPPLCTIQALNRMDDDHPHWWEQIFTKSTESYANLFQKHPHRDNQKECLPAMWAFLSPVKLTHQINQHSLPSKRFYSCENLTPHLSIFSLSAISLPKRFLSLQKVFLLLPNTVALLSPNSCPCTLHLPPTVKILLPNLRSISWVWSDLSTLCWGMRKAPGPHICPPS